LILKRLVECPKLRKRDEVRKYQGVECIEQTAMDGIDCNGLKRFEDSTGARDLSPDGTTSGNKREQLSINAYY